MVKVPPCSGKKMIKALQLVGFEVIRGGGKGSHTKVRDPKTSKCTVVPEGELTYVRHDIVKWAIKLGYSEKEILKNLD